jgi:chromatin remodeling complex protein RSC6
MQVEQLNNDKLNNEVVNVKKTSSQKFQECYLEYTKTVNLICQNLSKLTKLNSKLEKYEKVTGRKIKNKKISPSKNCSGFAKPTPVPLKLALLIGIEPNSCLPRPQVTKKLFSYIRMNSLNDKNPETGAKKGFILNDELKNIFGNFDTMTFKQFQQQLALYYKNNQVVTKPVESTNQTSTNQTSTNETSTSQTSTNQTSTNQTNEQENLKKPKKTRKPKDQTNETVNN